VPGLPTWIDYAMSYAAITALRGPAKLPAAPDFEIDGAARAILNDFHIKFC